MRDNMPFGSVGSGEFGTYFIGYARSPATTEQMLENMFIGSPPGNYDRILDFSTAVTGSLFFIPSLTLLDGFDDLTDESMTSGNGGNTQLTAPAPNGTSGSLNIGSLRGEAQI